MKSSLKPVVNHNHELINREKPKQELWRPGIQHFKTASTRGSASLSAVILRESENDIRPGVRVYRIIRFPGDDTAVIGTPRDGRCPAPPGTREDTG